MKCPSCGSHRPRVSDSRPSAGGAITRRRLKCPCGHSFNTIEIAVGGLHGRYAKDSSDDNAWSALIAACLDKITVTTMLHELRKRFDRSEHVYQDTAFEPDLECFRDEDPTL